MFRIILGLHLNESYGTKNQTKSLLRRVSGFLLGSLMLFCKGHMTFIHTWPLYSMSFFNSNFHWIASLGSSKGLGPENHLQKSFLKTFFPSILRSHMVWKSPKMSHGEFSIFNYDIFHQINFVQCCRIRPYNTMRPKIVGQLLFLYGVILVW